MSEGPGNGDDDPEAWEPVDQDGDPNGGDADRQQQWAERLEQKQQELDERERELEKREQEILERREENVEKREALDEREERLESIEQQLKERESELDGRQQQLDEREAEIETKREALEEYAASGRTFTKRPRIAGGILLGIVGVFSILLAVGTFLFTGQDGIVFLFEQTTRYAVTGGLVVIGLLELIGGFFAYRGRNWPIVVFAAILGIVVMLPVGITATIMLTVGEAQFD